METLGSLKGDFVLDGELVAFDQEGKPSFQLLQSNPSREVPVYFYAFDLLNRDGELSVNRSIERRRELLDRLLQAPKDPVRLSPLLQAPSGQVLEAVRKLGLEGVVGKRIGSIYEPGERSGAWIKLRTNMEQEFAIGGYVPGARGFGALLVGVCEKKELIFVAKVMGFKGDLRQWQELLRIGDCNVGASSGQAVSSESRSIFRSFLVFLGLSSSSHRSDDALEATIYQPENSEISESLLAGCHRRNPNGPARAIVVA